MKAGATSRRRAVILALAVVLVAAACSEPEPVTSAEGVASAGESVYAEYCAECHAESFTGTDDGPSLLEPEYLPENLPDLEMWRHIREGELQPEGDYEPMPGFPNIGRQAIADVMAYVRAVQAESR